MVAIDAIGQRAALAEINKGRSTMGAVRRAVVHGKLHGQVPMVVRMLHVNELRWKRSGQLWQENHDGRGREPGSSGPKRT